MAKLRHIALQVPDLEKAAGILMLMIGDKSRFYVLGGIMGVFFGPAQAASPALSTVSSAVSRSAS